MVIDVQSAATCCSTSCAATRARTDARGGTGLPVTTSARADRHRTVPLPVDRERVRAPLRAGAEDVGGAAVGEQVAHHDALPDDVGTEAVAAHASLVRLGFRRIGHGEILRLPASHPVPPQEDPVTYVIAQPCVDLKDRACVDECPVDCIYEGKRMLYIHPDECVDCGACEPVCPVEAIFYEDDTPEEWKDYYDANVHFFDDLGSPGGAAKMGVIDKDHPLVAALPPQEHDE